MIMLPLLDDFEGFMMDWIVPKYKKEVKTNRLAQHIIVFLKQSYRRDLVLVVATLYMSGVSPFMHEVEHHDNAVAIGGLWRAMKAEVIKLQENDRCLLNKRIDEGQFPLQNIRYTYQDGEREHNKSHAGLFAACKQIALKELASLSVTRKETVKAAHAFIFSL